MIMDLGILSEKYRLYGHYKMKWLSVSENFQFPIAEKRKSMFSLLALSFSFRNKFPLVIYSVFLTFMSILCFHSLFI